MIDNNSRYADGRFGQTYSKDPNAYDLFVLRSFTTEGNWNYVNYLVNEGDRIDILADVFLGSSRLWHQIMDLNPEIPDPFNIPAGTFIRIPR